MKRVVIGLLLGSALPLVACGGSGGGSSGVTVVPGSGGSTPTPAPSSPTPSPTATYKTYAELTGNQSFKTACAAFIFNANPPAVAPATHFGQGLTLDYTATSDSYAIGGDGLALSYGPADLDPAAPATVKGYIKTVDGFQQRFTIGRPATSGGTGLDYTRGFFLRALGPGSPKNYSCVFGVPTLLGDAPAVSTVTYSQTGLTGSAYRTEAGTTSVYSLQTSTVTLSVNLTTGAITSNIHLIGVLQTPSGPGATVDLGNYTGTGTIDTVEGSYYGQFTDVTGGGFAFFGGWFFGPQGRESGYAYNIFSRNGPVDIAAVGTVAAIK